MAFDKKTAMRNAERFLSQGKIRAAINEYKEVVKNDGRDFGTLNMLGDLYVKYNDIDPAIRCYTAVAEHYAKQGFAAKAIAVYNKITRLKPPTPEISQKLAELYREKGSVTEARSHYVTLAEHYERTNRKIEALAIWKQIAMLDPQNTDVFHTLGESFLKEGQEEEAIDAYVTLGERYQALGHPEDSAAAFDKALSIDRFSDKALKGLVGAAVKNGNAADAVARLEGLLKEKPRHRDVLRLLIDCHLKTFNPRAAEDALISLVEIEPSNFGLFVDLARLYLENGDVDSAARALSMSSEHLLAAGQIDQFRTLVNELLQADENHIEGLRLQIALCTWLRDESAYLEALRRLADAANAASLVEDERFALSQLVMVVPHEVAYRERLQAINAEHGFEDDSQAAGGFDLQFLSKNAAGSDAVSRFAADPVIDAGDVSVVNISSTASPAPANGNGNGRSAVVDAFGVNFENDEDRLSREIDSIKFYVENGYIELAQKAAEELKGDFGDRKEVRDLLAFIDNYASGGQPAAAAAPVQQGEVSGSFDLSELRSELGIDDPAADEASDFETQYNTAIAYQEMGLLEEAIKTFQEAANLVPQNDGTRRFYQCAYLIGHCFVQLNKPNLALMWFKRAMETPNLTADEKQGLWYEYAHACESNGDNENAAKYFEMVYAENIDFRDVGERLKNMAVAM